VRPIRPAVVLAALLATPIACASPGDGGRSALEGTRLEVVAVWEGIEEERFRSVLDRFESATGVAVGYTSTGGEDIAAVLDRRLASGDVPDLAILPVPGLLRRYARSGAIRPIGAILGDDALGAFAPVWRELGSVDGEVFGLWFKAAHKSLIWYRVGVFQDAGLVPPRDIEGLLASARHLADRGLTPFAVAGADEWTLTDWFENIYLRSAGPGRYDALADGRLPWTDPSVIHALELMAELLAPDLVAGGPAGASEATFTESVTTVFGPEPGAAMVFEGDFVAGIVTGNTEAVLGVDADVFTFPEIDDSGPMVVGGGDAVVLMRESEAAVALLRFLAGPSAGETWAAQGGFISPNEDVGLDRYPDDISRTIARSLLEAGDAFRFDLSDLQPAAFGATTGDGLLGILASYLVDPSDPAATAARLQEAATAAGVGPDREGVSGR
jgi:alpha-glucoside transport system substrate-binding protein